MVSLQRIFEVSGVIRTPSHGMECKDGSFTVIDVALVIAVGEPRHDIS
jgi:hypothetical protein